VPARVRLDQLIADRGLAPTRSRAQALLMSGRVRVGTGDGARVDRKSGDMVDAGIELQLVTAAPFVSRGGEKLAGALDAFDIDPAGRVCLDVGASTGGFTDCLLQRGAERVYALDVGRGQLAESLRVDPRVVSMERTHAARLDPGAPDRLVLPESVSLTVADVSFISLTRLLAGMAAATAPGGDILPMVKPQFELTPRDVPGGVVRDPALRAAAVARVRDHAAGLGLDVRGESESSLVGPSGNHEWFLWLQVPPARVPPSDAAGRPASRTEPVGAAT
jgi:23S rRNA (cytidine1920-2'-O)/16S rRNA (cytidine1409-2'-O)-methyltransferase